MEVDQAIDISPCERRTVLKLLRSYLPETVVWAYGSRVKWTARLESDLDLVAFAKTDQKRQVAGLRDALEESNLPFRVDLLVWNELPKDFHKRIKHQFVVLQDSRPASGTWKRMSLKDCVVRNDTTYSTKEQWPFINYLDTGNITANRIASIQHLRVGKDRIPARARRMPRAGDIVYSTVRPNQRHFGLLKEIPENFLVSTGFVALRGKERFAATEFLYWFLAQDHIVEQLHTLAEHSTSAYPSIRPEDMERLTVELPPLPEQRAIAHVLGALDDKIESNRRMSETLEAMTRALFKSWFVDFDPVRAKMEGRDTGLPEDVAALFPDRLVDSEASEAPEGWQRFTLADLAEHHTDTINPGRHPDSRFEHFSIPAYDRNQMGNVEPGSAVKSNKTAVPLGAVLLSKLNPDIPRAWAPPSGSGAVQQICSTEFLAFTPSALANRSLLLALFLSDAFRAMLRSMVTGTSRSHQRVPAAALKSRSVLWGDSALFRAFDEFAGAWLKRTLTNRAEVLHLAAIRDALLPKLISGEIRIPEAEKLVEAVA